jgi:hypothetical protein
MKFQICIVAAVALLAGQVSAQDTASPTVPDFEFPDFTFPDFEFPAFPEIPDFGLPEFNIYAFEFRVPTPGTIISLDQGGDGFDTAFFSNTTTVWGDSDASNGCPPFVPDLECNDGNDVFAGGEIFTFGNNGIKYQNGVLTFTDPKDFFMNSDDRIMSTNPISVRTLEDSSSSVLFTWSIYTVAASIAIASFASF